MVRHWHTHRSVTSNVDGMGVCEMDASAVCDRVRLIADRFVADRSQRQLRATLDLTEMDELAAAGILTTGLPADRQGLWHDLQHSTRGICEIYRTLAHGDPSVALASSMHPAVLALWLATPEVDATHQDAWRAQCDEIFGTVERGARWGTITSEPGSGGDVLRSNTTAHRDGDHWLLTGQKHFGSGSGTTSYMLTTAQPDGEDGPDWFYVPVVGLMEAGVPGVTISTPWDGHGMRATQSHALRFDACVAHRIAWPGHLQDLIASSAPFFGTLFTAVILGVVESAMEAAEQQLGPRADALRPYEQVEYARAQLDAWTLAAAYDAMVSAIEREGASAGARVAVLRGKTVSAEIAESCLLRLGRVLGGGTYSQRSPFGHWFEDVRALGFLRPPWGLAFDGLIAAHAVP